MAMSIEEEMETFIEDNQLDGEASGILRELDESLARELLDRGPLTDARNPSAVVLSRLRSIKTAEKNQRFGSLPPGKPKMDLGNLQREISKYVRDNELDERAESSLKEADEPVLRELLSAGPLTDARNPSAVVMARLKEIQRDLERGDDTYTARGKGGGGGGHHGGKSGGGGDMQSQIMRYVRENELDERAEQCLKETDNATLRELFARGPLHDARNPSAFVLSRLREIKRDMASGGGNDRRDDRDYGRDNRRYDSPPRRGGGGGGKGGKAEFMEFMNEMWDKWNGGGRDSDRRGAGPSRGGRGRGPY